MVNSCLATLCAVTEIHKSWIQKANSTIALTSCNLCVIAIVECKWTLFSQNSHTGLFVKVFVLSPVFEETIYCFRELLLWENGRKEIQFGI